ncbi:SGNH/GDSL hydrolase family protein [Rhizobium ruizarguesonis]|uniref:SGNH/GDSL hydrolase family protein n=1 Tax=Rhizobium ruizarguesonis TaxID=2081791 RepID=UPI0013EED627|nr:SGNH/GDSL hydrolase family protein [Rhizobium ruizarguesonis]
MAAFYASLVEARSSNRPISIHIEGDSKVAGLGVTDGYRLDQLLIEGAEEYPLRVSFEGFGGQNSWLWAHGKVDGFVANHGDADLLIINFGTNENVKSADGGAQSLEQTEANHLAAIAKIREHRSSAQLSILILGQTPGNNWNPRYNDTLESMTAINGVLRKVALETNSAFFDPLELFQRAHSEAGWMDQLPTPLYGGGNVHPGDAMNLAMVGVLADDLFPIPFRPTKRGNNRPELLNQWVPVDPATPARAALRGDMVVLDGRITGGDTKVGEKLMALPAGYRPPADRYILVPTSTRGTSVQLRIGADGFVRIASKYRGNYISLDGVSYLIE